MFNEMSATGRVIAMLLIPMCWLEIADLASDEHLKGQTANSKKSLYFHRVARDNDERHDAPSTPASLPAPTSRHFLTSTH
jgi:hypothetical protein